MPVDAARRIRTARLRGISEPLIRRGALLLEDALRTASLPGTEAGASAQLMAREGDYALVRLPSGETRKVHVECYASIGQMGNLEHENEGVGKAGRNRWRGIRPTVRGVAMNPVDHPHGGGEGKTSGGRPSCSPWGVPTKGKKTRNNPRTDAMIVRRRK